MHRNKYNGRNGNVGAITYRGGGSIATATQYTSTTSTPTRSEASLRNPYLRTDEAATSISGNPPAQILGMAQVGNSTLYPAAASMQVSPNRCLQPLDYWAETASRIPNTHLALTSGSAMPYDSKMASISHLYGRPNHADSLPLISRQPGSAAQTSHGQSLITTKGAFTSDLPWQRTVDDANLYRQPIREIPARYRRRSLSSVGSGTSSDPKIDTGMRIPPRRRLQQGCRGDIGQDRQNHWRNSPVLSTGLSSLHDRMSNSKGATAPCEQLPALIHMERKTNKTTRMPSFSSRKAVRLRDASGNITHKAAKSIPAAAEQTRPQKGRNEDGSIAKKPRSAKRREEGAKARGICSGQDGFSRSTDNRSVSPVPVPSFPSTIIQKIGKGIKRSTPLLDRLFRRRSVFGVPTAEPPFSEISQVQLSMVTREVDCGKVNINTNVQGDSGGTGHKKVERNLMDATNADADSRDQNSPWGNCVTSQDIVSPEKEQTEPAVIKKGILKRSAIDSGDMFPIILSANNEVASSKLLMISDVNGSPISFTPSAPSRIPQDTKQRHSVTIGRDVSTSDLRLYRKSAYILDIPPQNFKRSTTFSPQVQSYDTWPRDEYDRRGETAVCSQLTPILAQNIKEELNAFKMARNGSAQELPKIYSLLLRTTPV